MPYPRESQLEKFTKDFVFHNTAEKVELFLRDEIVIKSIHRKGSIILGIFWSNVLQCNHNFPPYPFIYEKEYDEDVKEEKLIVTVDDVTFSVYLTTGICNYIGYLSRSHYSCVFFKLFLTQIRRYRNTTD